MVNFAESIHKKVRQSIPVFSHGTIGVTHIINFFVNDLPDEMFQIQFPFLFHLVIMAKKSENSFFLKRGYKSIQFFEQIFVLIIIG